MEQKEKDQIKAKFGDINYEGLDQLEGIYDTYQIDRAMDNIRETIGTLEELLDNLESLKAGAVELIDGDPAHTTKAYTLNECGNIGEFAEEICFELDTCSSDLEEAYAYLAPLHRLMPTEDGEVYIDYRDKLDAQEQED